jgi:hypothetical protein
MLMREIQMIAKKFCYFFPSYFIFCSKKGI